MKTIKRTLISIDQRVAISSAHFGLAFPCQVEPTIFNLAGSMAPSYTGGYWEFYSLDNGGFYMAPEAGRVYPVSCQNYYSGELSGDALGIVACLCAYSHISFGSDQRLAQTCARLFHWLRAYAAEHPEAVAIYGAID